MPNRLPNSPVLWVQRLAPVVAAALLALTHPAFAETFLVKDQEAYARALVGLAPGDKLVLANGTWRDFEIVFVAKGTETAPITLEAESPGQVIVSGESSLNIAGEHLVVRGLTFKDGASPGGEVISFRVDDEGVANHTRLTETVIDGFNKTDRTEQDNWISLHGKHNQIDHSYFAGKTNKAPTLVVRLDKPESRENHHVIEHNYFGPRPTLGGNGGETIRVGVSSYSRLPSKTRIVRNYFEHCDGEVEILSLKSEDNVVSENVFFESRGAVVFRHGGRNVISRNIFFGNGVSDTGGVRVINEQQTVKNNYFEGLRGEKFLSALTIMNGVPNSPINRYHQVSDAQVSNNSFIDFTAIGLAVGSDEERSAAPVKSVVNNNFFVTDSAQPVSVFDDISGIRFDKNVSANPAMESYSWVADAPIEFVRAANGLLYPVGEKLAEVGAPRDLDPVKRDDTGPSWYEKPLQSPAAGREIKVKSGAAALRRALEESQPGDILKLRGKSYTLKRPLEISHPITIDGKTRRGKKTVFRSQGDAAFEVVAGAALTLSDMELVGAANNTSVIKASGATFKGNYALHMTNVDVSAEPKASGLTFMSADRATFATAIELDEVSVSDWPGTFISLSGTKLNGWYLAEDIQIENSNFEGLAGPLLEFGRAGKDESTFGPRVLLSNSKLSKVNAEGVAIELDGIDGIDVQGNRLSDSGKLQIRKRVLGLKFIYGDNTLERTPPPEFLGVEGEPLAASSLGAPE